MVAQPHRKSSSGAIEAYYPIVGGMIAFLTIWISGCEPNRPTIPNLLSSVLTISSIAVGFIGTARSHLLSIKDRPHVKAALDDGGDRVHGYFNVAIASAMILCAICILGFFIDFSKCASWHGFYFSVWAGLLLLTGLAAHRVLGVMYEFLTEASPQ